MTGRAVVVPLKSRNWTMAHSFVSYLESVEGVDAGTYMSVVSGIFSTGYGCGECCEGIMNFLECSPNYVMATDGGQWWLGDDSHSEPNGDWDQGCFLTPNGNLPSAEAIESGSFIDYNDQG